MIELIVTTILWAFSFSLIGVYLSGFVDPWFVVLIRAVLAFLFFLPLGYRGRLSNRTKGVLMSIGAVQLGIMYFFYYQSFLYLTVPEILLFTVMTPIYVTLCYDLLAGNRLRLGYLFSAAIAVLGAVVIRYQSLSSEFWWGLLLLQGANICFAIGQVGYKRLQEQQTIPAKEAFVWFYFGAVIISLVGWCLFGNLQQLPTTTTQWGILIWLGIGASGIGYFLWNSGATKVDAGTLAIMNNSLIPLGLLVNFLLWQQHVDWLRLTIGGTIIFSSLLFHRYWIVKK